MKKLKDEPNFRTLHSEMTGWVFVFSDYPIQAFISLIDCNGNVTHFLTDIQEITLHHTMVQQFQTVLMSVLTKVNE